MLKSIPHRKHITNTSATITSLRQLIHWSSNIDFSQKLNCWWLLCNKLWKFVFRGSSTSYGSRKRAYTNLSGYLQSPRMVKLAWTSIQRTPMEHQFLYVKFISRRRSISISRATEYISYTFVHINFNQTRKEIACARIRSFYLNLFQVNLCSVSSANRCY